MTGLGPLVGHAEVRRSLSRAMQRGTLSSSLLIHGPQGVGKQRLALWLAQLLVCHSPADGEPCGRCQPCRLALRLEHPDIHWFFPLPRPRVSGSPERLQDALEEARAAELALRREQPYRPPTPGEVPGIFLAQVTVLRRRAVARPAMGEHKVFIVGEAELLVPQESSPEAANALLKVLEEPTADTTVILTATTPQALLPTLRSRVLPVRLTALPVEEVSAFLTSTLDVPPEQAERVARLAEGSIGRALAFLPQEGGPGPLEVLRVQAREYLDAALAATPGPLLAMALAQPPARARGAFLDTLEFLALWLRDLAAVATGAPELVLNVDALKWLTEVAQRVPAAAGGTPAALGAIQAAVQSTQININPQLTLAWLLRSIREQLRVA